MENRTFWKKLWPLVLPIAFQQLMSALVSTSDTLMTVSYTHLTLPTICSV